jgi:hypothetical protein
MQEFSKMELAGVLSNPELAERLRAVAKTVRTRRAS